MANHRYISFWPQDWVNDPALRACSLEARGLWIELICLAHGCEPYGHLVSNGAPMKVENIAKFLQCNPRTIRKLLEELDRNGVFSRDSNGAIYSRRMVRDGKKSKQGQQSAERRWKKPPNGSGNGGPNGKPNDKPNGSGNGGPNAQYQSTEEGIPHKGVYPSSEARARELRADAPLAASTLQAEESDAVDPTAAKAALADLVAELTGRRRLPEIPEPELTPEEQVARLKGLEP